MLLILVIVAVVCYLIYTSTRYSRNQILFTVGGGMLTFLMAPLVIDQIRGLSYSSQEVVTDGDNDLQ